MRKKLFIICPSFGFLSSVPSPNFPLQHTAHNISNQPTNQLLTSFRSYFEDQLPEYARVLRVMPNTPSLVGQGASGLCLGRNATQEDADLVKRLMSATGLAVQIEESQMDALTGVSGDFFESSF